MNIRFLRILLTLIFAILCQPSLAQQLLDTLKLQNMLLNDISDQGINTPNQDLVSKNQDIANTDNILQIDLSQAIAQREVNEKSMLKRYFHALIGEDLNFYGSNEFNRPQDDKLLFF